MFPYGTQGDKLDEMMSMGATINCCLNNIKRTVVHAWTNNILRLHQLTNEMIDPQTQIDVHFNQSNSRRRAWRAPDRARPFAVNLSMNLHVHAWGSKFIHGSIWASGYRIVLQ
jgi:hypothetical protein